MLIKQRRRPQRHQTGEESEAADAATTGAQTLRVGSLKGPTTIGLVSLMDEASKGESEGAYEFTMAADASELAAQVVSGDLDIALVPANLASVLYQKTKQGIEVIDINTLGVLYVVSADDSIHNNCRPEGKNHIHDRKRNHTGLCTSVSDRANSMTPMM